MRTKLNKAKANSWKVKVEEKAKRFERKKKRQFEQLSTERLGPLSVVSFCLRRWWTSGPGWESVLNKTFVSFTIMTKTGKVPCSVLVFCWQLLPIVNNFQLYLFRWETLISSSPLQATSKSHLLPIFHHKSTHNTARQTGTVRTSISVTCHQAVLLSFLFGPFFPLSLKKKKTNKKTKNKTKQKNKKRLIAGYHHSYVPTDQASITLLLKFWYVNHCSLCMSDRKRINN